MNCSPPGSSVHGIFPGKNIGVGCHFLPQVIFLTQGLNLCLLHGMQILYCWATREAKEWGELHKPKTWVMSFCQFGDFFFWFVLWECLAWWWSQLFFFFLRCEIFSKPDVQKRLGTRMFTHMLSPKPPKPSKMMIIEMYWAFLVAQTVKKLSAMQETQVQSLRQEDPLEMEMATHSSILALRIPWTVEPGRLQSMRSQRVGHNEWLTLSHHWYRTQGFIYWQCWFLRLFVKHLWNACGQTSKPLMWKDSW